VPARQIVPAHLVVAISDAGQRIDARRILARRLAEAFQGERDIAQDEVAAGLGDAERHRLLSRLQPGRRRADLELALFSKASGAAQHRRRYERHPPMTHLNFPQHSGPA